MLSPTGKTPDYKGKRIGLIFDGPTVVGTFASFTSEDCYGQRKMFDVSMYKNYVDSIFLCSDIPLTFRFVEVQDYENNKFKLIEDFGFGAFTTSKGVFFDDKHAIMSKITWLKCPAGFQNAN